MARPVNRYSDLVYGGDANAEQQAKVGDAFTLGLGGFEGSNERKAAVNQILGVDPLQLDETDYTAPGYAGDFRPELYGTPEAAKYETINVDPRTREMALQALQRLQGYSDQAADSSEVLGRTRAINEANQLAGQREGAIAAAAARRGQGGSGLEYVLRNQAAQAGAARAQSGGLESAQQAALQRLQGTQSALQGANAIRVQDVDLAGRNAAIINAFNMANSNARNAANFANVDARNAAAMRNLGTQQTNLNTQGAVQNANIDRRNANQRSLYDARMGQATAAGNALMGKANAGQAAASENRSQAWGMAKDLARAGSGLFDDEDK